MSDVPDPDPIVDPQPAFEPDRIKGLVVLRGAATALIVSMPAAFINVVMASQTPKPRALINISYLVVMIGFFIGGYLAGKEAPLTPAKHGALAGFVAFIPVEVV